MTIWASADLHLGHRGILALQNRPFANTHEMNEEIITRWNSRVGKNDTVYLLGDFSFKIGWKKALELFSRLNGKIRLVRGNHDKQSVIDNLPFAGVYDVKRIEYRGYSFFMSHYAHRVWYHSNHPKSLMIFGHSHNVLTPWPKSMDVGVDSNNFYPYSLDEIIEKLKQE